MSSPQILLVHQEFETLSGIQWPIEEYSISTSISTPDDTDVDIDVSIEIDKDNNKILISASISGENTPLDKDSLLIISSASTYAMIDLGIAIGVHPSMHHPISVWSINLDAIIPRMIEDKINALISTIREINFRLKSKNEKKILPQKYDETNNMKMIKV